MKMKVMMMQMGMSQSTPGDWERASSPKRFEDYEVYVTVEEEDKFMLIGGPVGVAQFTQIAPNMIPVKFD
jgi:hypothetical protein